MVITYSSELLCMTLDHKRGLTRQIMSYPRIVSGVIQKMYVVKVKFPVHKHESRILRHRITHLYISLHTRWL